MREYRSVVGEDDCFLEVGEYTHREAMAKVVREVREVGLKFRVLVEEGVKGVGVVGGTYLVEEIRASGRDGVRKRD